MIAIWRKLVILTSVLSLLTFFFYSPHAETKRKIQKSKLKQSIERGKYLTEIIGCGICHTPWSLDPKTGQSFPQTNRLLSGAPEGTQVPKTNPILPENVDDMFNKVFKGGWGTSFAANLTPDKETGIGKWSFEDFRNAIRMGKYKSQWSHRGDSRPIMPPMPWEDLGKMTDTDLHAIYNYLMTIPPVKNKVPEFIPPH